MPLVYCLSPRRIGSPFAYFITKTALSIQLFKVPSVRLVKDLNEKTPEISPILH